MNSNTRKGSILFGELRANLLTEGKGKLILGLAVILYSTHPAAFGQEKPRPFSTSAERCIVPASEYHSVNPYILRAILMVESKLNPGAIGHNEGGSVDVGIGQMNSIHFKELSKFGIGPNQLKDACIGTYVAAWHLRKGINQFGNTWEAIARYHSATPYFNNRYQILLRNELVRSGAMTGGLSNVPPLRPASVGVTAGTSAKGSQASSDDTRLAINAEISVFDQSR